MKKGRQGRKLSRKTDPRGALLRGLARALFLKERIRTTEAKAKTMASFAQKQITLAKEGGLASRRQLSKKFSTEMVKKLIDEIAPRYKERKGGYTRILKLGQRKSDGAKMVIIELVK
ncbi:MAG: 50S ribosomal protein L17 [Candidatus Nealsonbacteria bacterium]|nr:50S ribosomal protein L17 [Candidatus Nealsonbacteria bacterium]